MTNRICRIYLSTVVETMGFEPIVAGDGPEALEKARALLPALVILDVMMPKIEDGLRTYQQFREDEGLGTHTHHHGVGHCQENLFPFYQIVETSERKAVPRA